VFGVTEYRLVPVYARRGPISLCKTSLPVPRRGLDTASTTNPQDNPDLRILRVHDRLTRTAQKSPAARKRAPNRLTAYRLKSSLLAFRQYGELPEDGEDW
jgi:hypothetical protein